jgi:YebC/PmpR family DNA-binding regulatory protein
MSGHSKWHSIRHKKAAVDAKRGKIFTKLIKEISVAARIGGGDPEANPRLRTAIQTAKAANMPQSNISRAIKKGTGELPGMAFESVTYEGYGPAGVAVFLEALTDNKNRTVAEIRHLFSKHGGNLGESGSVNWMFERKGYIEVSHDKADEAQLFEIAVEAGAEDMKTAEETFEITTPFEQFEGVRQAVEAAGIETEIAQLTMIPTNAVHLEGKEAERMLRLMDVLEDHDDVQNAYANFDIDEETMESLAGV